MRVTAATRSKYESDGNELRLRNVRESTERRLRPYQANGTVVERTVKSDANNALVAMFETRDAILIGVTGANGRTASVFASKRLILSRRGP